MGSVTTAMPTSFKAELALAMHNWSNVSGSSFKAALIKVSPTGTYDANTTNYSNLTSNSDETSGTGYSVGGFAWSVGQNIPPATSSGSAYWSWSVNPSWAAATMSMVGCIFYNISASNAAVYVGSFGGTQTVTGGTFTILLPTNGVGTSVLQIL
jgi:hypothetical protein